jgi:hypothetical protein
MEMQKIHKFSAFRHSDSDSIQEALEGEASTFTFTAGVNNLLY